LRVRDKLSKIGDRSRASSREKSFLLKRETHEEEKNIQKGGGRGKGRETKGFALLPKLARMRRY
jgi:hypothetical protein